MIVVADSGPPHYLILLEHIELLHRLYGQVAIPEAVANGIHDRQVEGHQPSQIAHGQGQNAAHVPS